MIIRPAHSIGAGIFSGASRHRRAAVLPTRPTKWRSSTFGGHGALVVGSWVAMLNSSNVILRWAKVSAYAISSFVEVTAAAGDAAIDYATASATVKLWFNAANGGATQGTTNTAVDPVSFYSSDAPGLDSLSDAFSLFRFPSIIDTRGGFTAANKGDFVSVSTGGPTGMGYLSETGSSVSAFFSGIISDRAPAARAFLVLMRWVGGVSGSRHIMGLYGANGSSVRDTIYYNDSTTDVYRASNGAVFSGASEPIVPAINSWHLVGFRHASGQLASGINGVWSPGVAAAAPSAYDSFYIHAGSGAYDIAEIGIWERDITADEFTEQARRCGVAA